MTDVNTYCDYSYKRLVGLKAGLYDVMTKAGRIQDDTHGEAARKLSALVASIEAGIEELKDQCPPDWSPNRLDLRPLARFYTDCQQNVPKKMRRDKGV